MPGHIIALLAIICGGYCGQSSDMISLGIDEIQLRKTAILLEMQSLDEISCLPAEVILIWSLHPLLPSMTKKTPINVSI